MERDYLVVNRAAYDTLADEYRKRADADRVRDTAIVLPFADYLRSRFGENARVLDIGPGNGVNLAMLRAFGFEVVGVDISCRMLEIARESCPEAELVLGDFLSLRLPESSFHGVFAKASIHLMPKEDALRAIAKVYGLLRPGGMFYVTTTMSHFAAEGYSVKSDYHRKIERFRKYWTRDELRDNLIHCGFKIHQESINEEPERRKVWMNFWAVREGP